MRILIYFFFLMIAFAAKKEKKASSELVYMRGGNISSKFDKDFKYPDLKYDLSKFETIANISVQHVIYRSLDEDDIEKLLDEIPNKEKIKLHKLPTPVATYTYVNQTKLWMAEKRLIKTPFIKQELSTLSIKLQPETTNLFFVIFEHGNREGNMRFPDFSAKDFVDFIDEIFKNNTKLEKMILIVKSCYSYLFSKKLRDLLRDPLRKKVTILETTSGKNKWLDLSCNYQFNPSNPPHQFHHWMDWTTYNSRKFLF
jgi:hypothetical protein